MTKTKMQWFCQSKNVTTASSRWIAKFQRLKAVVTFGLTILILTPFTHAQRSPKREFSHSQYGHLNNWTYSQPLASDIQFEQAWTKTVGHGRSQVVSHDDRVFVAVGEDEKRKGKPSIIHSRLLCLDRYSGDEIWKHQSDSMEMYEEQESFSGAPISPQATPLLVGNSIVSVTFTGLLECLNTETGEIRWKIDLVEDLYADPVQFGFSASPVVDSQDSNRIYVMAAGAKGGLYCLNLDDGKTIWKAECESQSYATPTHANLAGVDQLIAITKDEAIGINTANGQRLWSHKLAEKGLTNVPSPIVLPDGMIISGQGCNGTRRIEIRFANEKWTTSEKWYSKKIQFFYSNWMLAGPNMATGCDGKLLIAFDIEDGSTLGRWRGFSDSNILKIGESTIVVDGKGNLNVLSPEMENATKPHMLHLQKIALLKQRCWTPPSVVENGLLLRGADQLTMIRYSERVNQPLQNKLKKPKTLALKRTTAGNKKDVDYVQAIFDTFEEKGANAALKLYGQLRAKVPCPLVAQDRIDLFNAAKQQGMSDLAKMILAHALEDFPDSGAIRELAKDSK